MVKRVEGDGVPKPFTIFSFNPDADLSDMSQFENIFYKYVATPKGKYFYNHGQKNAYKEYEEDREKLRKRFYKWFEIVLAFATGAASHIFYNWIDMRYFNN